MFQISLKINTLLKGIDTFSQRIRLASFNAIFIYNIYIYIFMPVKCINKIIRNFFNKV